MKIIWLIWIIFPVFGMSQTRKERKAQEKADESTLAGLRSTIIFLSSDSLEGRRAGSQGELLAMQYISTRFQKEGLQPAGTNGYVQEFTINEGKAYDKASSFLTVNNQTLALTTDFFPLPFSGNGIVSGDASPGLREKGTPWFWDVKYSLEDNQHNPGFDISKEIVKQAAEVSKNGGTALIVYNSSNLIDQIAFNPKDSLSPSVIPIIYLNQNTLKKYFPDPTDFYHLRLGVKISPRTHKARNVIGYINNNAPATVILSAHYDDLGYGEDGNSLDGYGKLHPGANDNASGTAALIELGRILQNSFAKNNNYLFIAFSGEEQGMSGCAYWIGHPTIPTPVNYLLNMDMIGRYDSLHKLLIGEFGNSREWEKIFQSVSGTQLLLHFDSSSRSPCDQASFYNSSRPVLNFSTGAEEDFHKASDVWQKINFSDEVRIIRLIEQIIAVANDHGRLAYTTNPDRQFNPVLLPLTLSRLPGNALPGSDQQTGSISKWNCAESIRFQRGDLPFRIGDNALKDIAAFRPAVQKFKKEESTVLD